MAWSQSSPSSQAVTVTGGSLSKENNQKPFPQWAFIRFNLHRNTGRIHKAQSVSGSNDQTIDNKEL